MITRELVIVSQALRSTADDGGHSVDKLGIVFLESGPAPALEEATSDVESAGHLAPSLGCEIITLSPPLQSSRGRNDEVSFTIFIKDSIQREPRVH